MRYWDTSALVPLIIEEPRTQRARDLLKEDPLVVTWGWTRVEMIGAVERRAREGTFTPTQRREALDRVLEIAQRWDEVTDLLAARTRAAALLGRYELRAADAAQLAAGLVVADPDPASVPFVCFDDRLALAAEREGFRVLG